MRNKNALYMAGVALVFAGLAAARPDLVAGAFRATAASLSAGGAAAAKVLFEIALLGAILLVTVKVVPEGADPAADLPVILAASVYGYIAEFAGTRLGLWSYYTRETPPLWIIPAWPIGALLVSRLAVRAEPLLRRVAVSPDAIARWWGALFFVVFVSFLYGVLAAWQLLAACLAAAWVLRAGRRGRYASVMLTGTVCVLFADIWGTTNNCWGYHTGKDIAGLSRGVIFGGFFDTLVVLASLKTAAAARGLFEKLAPIK